MSTSPGNNEHNNHLFGGISDSGEYKKCILDNWLIAYSVKKRILIRFFFFQKIKWIIKWIFLLIRDESSWSIRQDIFRISFSFLPWIFFFVSSFFPHFVENKLCKFYFSSFIPSYWNKLFLTVYYTCTYILHGIWQL